MSGTSFDPTIVNIFKDNSDRVKEVYYTQIMFITLEGPEGSGKSTALKLVVEELSSRGYNIKMTREPGGVQIAEEIRGVILNKENTAMSRKTEALL